MVSRKAIHLVPVVAFASLLMAQDPPGPVPAALMDTVEWRLLGPFRGGRVAAVTGVVGDRDTYYFGAAGGGVWKTKDGGQTWKNVSDGTFGGSIGAIAVAPSNPDVVYVGGGEKTWRGNVSSGDGIWKSTDAGKSWHFSGLPDARHIARIRIDPKNPDVVFAAVMGHVSGPNDMRGVYRSKDGGTSWQRVHFVDAHVGAVDLCFGGDDANVLYATTWRGVRTPWSLESGGDGSGLWKSTDGGDTWTSLLDKPGMPKAPIGMCCISVCKAEPTRVYAQIEAEKGGLFRSDDAGATWQRINDDHALRQRAWYFSCVTADPKDKDVVYGLNVEFHKSTDGGKTFARIGVPHGDNHDLWIDPADPQRMIEGNDGGAIVTVDGGRSWSSLDNQPTAQFYRVAVDDDVPYRVYAAQQDNSAIRIAHRSRGDGIGNGDWQSTAGGESGWLAPKPGDADIVFGGSYDGYLQRLDHKTGLSRSVDVWPDNPMGDGCAELSHRFQWNFPILWSRHDPHALYAAAQSLFVTRDEGQTWQAISGDLTRNDKSKMGPSGGPITKDNTSVEYYGTIFTLDEGKDAGTIWCGSDDGLVHVTTDGGKTWSDVTPPMAPEWLQINCIAHDPFHAGGCYVAGTRYKLDDFRPYLYVTSDFGKSWREITGGLDAQWFTRCIRPDPELPGLLYCGTERTAWVSFDDGRRWQKLNNNLPLVPVDDLIVNRGSLIAATQGRALWSFDGLAHLRQLHADLALAPMHLFAPVPVQQFPGDDGVVDGKGRNPAKDLHVRFYIGGAKDAAIPERTTIEVTDFDGKVLFTRATDAEAPPEDLDEDRDKEKNGDAGDDERAKSEDKVDHRLTVKRGMNDIAVTWKAPKTKILKGMILWAGHGGGPRPAPGDYTIKVTFGEQTQSVVGKIEPDPRSSATVAELQARYRLVRDGNTLVTEAHDAIASMRSMRKQMQLVVDHSDGDGKARLETAQKDAAAGLDQIEQALYQTKSKSGQDPLNFPIKLTDKLLGVLGAVDGAEFGPTAAQVEVAQQLSTLIRAELTRFDDVKANKIAVFNKLALELAVPHVK